MIKRVFDVTLAAALLVISLPIMIALAIGVQVSIGRPIFFKQLRVGLKGKQFHIVKFRTMRDMRDTIGQLLPDEERVSRFGAFLRRSRLDELPELWLILSGRMSFVGPRPLPLSALDGSHFFEYRARYRPGLTGLAQVSGNTLLDQNEKFSIDILYNDSQSLLLDIYILIKTLTVVFFGERKCPYTLKKALAHAHDIDRRG